MADSIVSYQQIKPAGACRYDGVALGEVMLRFDPYDIPMPLAREMRIFQGWRGDQCGLRSRLHLRLAVCCHHGARR